MRTISGALLVSLALLSVVGCAPKPSGTSVNIHDNSGPVTANVGGSNGSPGGTGNTGASANNGGAAGTAPCAATGGGGTGATNTPNCGGQGATTTTTIPERTVQGSGAADLTAGSVSALLEGVRR